MRHAAQKPHRESAFGGAGVDLGKASDMADHFGKYPLQEVEEMRSALHADRLQHYADEGAGYRSDLDPDDEIGRILLEEDLNLQLRLLREANKEKMTGTPPFAMDGAMTIQHHEPQHHAENEAGGNQGLTNQVKAIMTLGTGVPEAIMLCLAVLVVMGMPHTV